MRNQLFIFSALSALGSAAANPAADADCKCTPSDPCWPSDSQWATLNTTLSGRLIHTHLPAAVCYRSNPAYNQSACTALYPEWTTPEFHSADPASIPAPHVAGNTCNPIYENGTSIAGDPDAGKKGCTIGEYPPYVVNATGAADVQAAVRFATEHSLRLIVKNTGHSSGRVVGKGALSIWTHHFKGFEFHDGDFVPEGCAANGTKGIMAATVGAGLQDGELYEAAAAHGAAMTGGTNSDVGILGWATGGGHGFFTSEHGMGADNIIQAKLVTPTGKLITTNACQNTDVFWALRGGGGGTFGVVLEATLKAYPAPKRTDFAALGITQKNGTSTEDYYRAVARLFSQLPALKEKGFQGYLPMGGKSCVGSFFMYDKPNGTAQAAWTPVKKALAEFEDVVDVSSQFMVFTDWYNQLFKVYTASSSDGKGGGARTSRLLPKEALEDEEALAKTLQMVGPQGSAHIEGPISDFSLSASMIASSTPEDNALNPAWRDAVVHLISSVSWDDATPADVAAAAQRDMTDVRGGALRKLAPESGAYVNEADTEEPQWQASLFGKNYERLSGIKEKVDPEGLLWCKQCVGSEAWREDGEGKLCRAG
ncbi:uncharacterized protein K452DRAFT_353552 [Aplosporella prunicola CBS 121167]|uniref:FAD-binding PCMH-type domain-containing protein n=1 Tax=Aplosporella prunicola CBS 121167 TaxID=1176127 RepID=A0A6A6AZR5_9PEZI|nr:uncharacterized protein K452DRAFT_353552 [Aplosporella prunicola CBS 121167]KAF2137409.1 hypothetical protein K452DRAFT_353552 [Aplosporella prunicola CBS 121167]